MTQVGRPSLGEPVERGGIECLSSVEVPESRFHHGYRLRPAKPNIREHLFLLEGSVTLLFPCVLSGVHIRAPTSPFAKASGDNVPIMELEIFLYGTLEKHIQDIAAAFVERAEVGD